MTENVNSNYHDKNNIPNSNKVEKSSTATEKVGTFASLAIPNFRLLLIGSVFIYAAQWIQQVLLNWLIYDMTGSGTILGSINIVWSLASFVMLFVVGILVDRYSRRKLMSIENGCIFIVTFGLGLGSVIGYNHISFLFIFAFIAGIIQTLDMTLRQVLVFDFVPRSLAPNALALNQTGWAVMRVLGPSIGGFFILWFGAGGSFLVLSNVYIIIAVTIILLKFPKRKPEITDSSPFQNIREGLNHLVKDRVTRTFTLIGIIMPLLAIPIFSVLPPIYAVEVFGDESGKILGFLMGSVGVGGIVGGIVTASLRRFEHWGRLQLGAILLLSLSLIAFAFSTMLLLALFLLALAGFFEIIFLTANQTLIQLSIPDSIRGRVTAVVNLTWMISPLGSMLAGGGSDLLGGPKSITIIMSGMAAIIVIIIFLISPTVRNYRLSQGISSNEPDADSNIR